MKRITTALILVLVLSSATFVYSVEVGDTPPSFVCPDLEGAYRFSAEFYGRAWTLVDFFATDCEPCKEELPELQEFHEKYRPFGLNSLIIALDVTGIDAVAPFFDSNPVSLTVLLDRYRVAADKYGVRQIPTVFLVDPDGSIAFVHEGYSPEAITEMDRILATAFGATAGE